MVKENGGFHLIAVGEMFFGFINRFIVL